MEYVALDDLEERRLAKNNPAMFFQLHSQPIFIDEVQYASELFSYEWLEAFNTFSIYEVLPQLIELWGLNVETQADSKKNIEKLTAR